MNLTTTIARLLLGLLFLTAGTMGFAISNPPPLPGMAGAFNDAFVHSHWSLFLAVAQMALGTLLLANRLVPVALIMLAAFLYNSFAFHLTMAPAGLPVAATVAILWFVVSWTYRHAFVALFTASPIAYGCEVLTQKG